MCGIAGYIGPSELPAERIADTLGLLHHRGPDRAGSRHHRTGDGRHVHLLATRLSIIDLDERSDQPFEVDDMTLVYNGELYNYLELRSDLQADGASFRTSSDTEVVARSLLRGGAASLEAFEGMYALAAYDAR